MNIRRKVRINFRDGSTYEGNKTKKIQQKKIRPHLIE